MSRTMKELTEECGRNGVSTAGFKGSDDFELGLQKFYWEKANPGIELPLQVDVMLARDASKLTVSEFESTFENSGWVAEQKIDGCRGVLILEKGKTPRITSRRRSDKNFLYEEKQKNLPHFRDFNWNFNGLTVVDGELVHPVHSIITSDGVETKSQLQTVVAMLNSGPEKSAEMQKKYGPVEFIAFDLLWLEGWDLRGLAFSERRRYLEVFLAGQPEMPQLSLVKQWNWSPGKSFRSIFTDYVRSGGEGLMLKSLGGVYRSIGRPKTMYKFKKFVSYDAFISGHVDADEGKGYAGLIGAFEVSAYIDGIQTAIGSVSAIDMVTRKLATVAREGVVSLNPDFIGRVVEVKGQEWSKNKRLTHCQMVQWRPDKSPTECKIGGARC